MAPWDTDPTKKHPLAKWNNPIVYFCGILELDWITTWHIGSTSNLSHVDPNYKQLVIYEVEFYSNMAYTPHTIH